MPQRPHWTRLTGIECLQRLVERFTRTGLIARKEERDGRLQGASTRPRTSGESFCSQADSNR